MLHFIFWYLVVSVLGLVAFPILSSLLPNLPDKGYIFSRTFGLLFVGYVHWLLGILKITDNSAGGILFSILIVVGLSVYAVIRRGWGDITRWMKGHQALIIVSELLFLVAFGLWAYIRSLNPDIVGTEKPMELAFINAISRSETFPPHDPWLAGYAISYYYFGYVLVAMLAKITATAGGVAFNLGVSLIFSLSVLGAYGIVYNLLKMANPKGGRGSAASALLGPFFTVIVSNWEGFLHFLHSRGVFWRQDASGQWTSSFWRWLDILDLADPPTGQSFGHWWWWRASRVIQDIDFLGNGKEVISEFPFFSYLLGDLHPHVLAMPFGFLIMGMALAVFIRKEEKDFRWLGLFPIQLSLGTFLVVALAAGGMSFLNIWDFPMYVALLAAAYALRDVLQREGWHPGLILKDFLSFGIAVGATGFVFYLPFFIGFDSQAGGLIPNLLYVTPGSQLWVMFGPLFVPLFTFLIYLWRRQGGGRNLRVGFMASMAVILFLLVFSLILVGVIPLIPPLEGIGSVIQVYMSSIGAPSLQAAVSEGLLRRLTSPGTWLTLLLMGAIAIGILWKAKPEEEEKDLLADREDQAYRFSLLLIVAGMLLVLVPEFVYLRDLFGYRLNTIFKFYYLAWLMWSVVAAFGTITLFQRLRLPWSTVFAVLFTISLAMALVYPAIGLWSRTNGFNPITGKTLDGADYFKDYLPDDAAAVAWLKKAPFGVVVESVGGSYSSHARISTYSGLPTILGWDFHEIQWRGTSELVNPRKQDVKTVYCTRDWAEAERIMNAYEVRYVVVGGLERTTYTGDLESCPGGLQEAKFFEHMEILFQQGQVTIYRH
jgi:YYY domain-containing protein